jgi:hypothetical protein
MKCARLLILILMITLPGSAIARDSLGVFDSWGAFRESNGPVCYAIAEPARPSVVKSGWSPFASVGNWPGRRVRAQFHVRLSRAKAPDAKVYLSIGERRLALMSSGADAWAQDTAMDSNIIAAMRSASTMSVESRDTAGQRFSDLYVLKGAATAMDAAALGCSRTQ